VNHSHWGSTSFLLLVKTKAIIMNAQKPLKYEVRKVKLGYAVFGLFQESRKVFIFFNKIEFNWRWLNCDGKKQMSYSKVKGMRQKRSYPHAPFRFKWQAKEWIKKLKR